MSKYIGDVAVAVFVIAIVYVLVRPRSKGVALVTGFGSMVTAIVNAATDLANPDS